MGDLELLRRLGRGFIWLGALSCGIYLLLALPSVRSFSGFLLTLADTVARLSSTVGLGAVLLVLTKIADSLRIRRDPSERPEHVEP